MLRPTATNYAFASCDLDATIADICSAALDMLEEQEPPTQRAPSFASDTRKMPVFRIPPEAYRER